MDNEAKDKKKGAHERYVSPAVEQASLILFSLAGARSTYMSLTEICASVGIHKSKAFTILETLQRFGLVRKNTDAIMPGPAIFFRKSSRQTPILQADPEGSQDADTRPAR